MIGVSVSNIEKIDTKSLEIRNHVAQDVAKYILDNWNKCVECVDVGEPDKPEILFKITL